MEKDQTTSIYKSFKKTMIIEIQNMKLLFLLTLVAGIPSPDDAFESLGDGFITEAYFNEFIVPMNESSVQQNQTWFLYLFHSYCNTKKCMTLNEAYS